MKPVFQKMTQQRVSVKELTRNFFKYDTKGKGFIDKDDLEKIFKKLKINLTGDEFGDVEHIADPEKEGNMNYGIIIALCAVAIDEHRPLVN